MLLLIKLAVVFIVSFILSIQDLKDRRISWWIIVLGDLIFICLQLFDYGLLNGKLEASFWLFPVQSFCMFLFYLLVRIISGNKLGSGDVLFGTFIGLCVKWNLLYLTLVITVICADIYFFLIWKLKKINLQAIKIPFIPFMSAGLISVYLLDFFVERF